MWVGGRRKREEGVRLVCWVDKERRGDADTGGTQIESVTLSKRRWRVG